jgi:plasmid rolling circle replication initiator protein Rep
MEFVYYVHDGEVVKRITSYTNKARSFNTTAGLQNMELSELTEISSDEELIKRRT